MKSRNTESNVSISQIDKFREAAREADTDDREEAFDRIVKKIAKAPPPKDDKPKQEDD